MNLENLRMMTIIRKDLMKQNLTLSAEQNAKKLKQKQKSEKKNFLKTNQLYM